MNTALLVWLLFIVITLLELFVLTLKTARIVRVSLGLLTVLLLSFVHVTLLFWEPLAFSVPFALIGIYRVVNMIRFSSGRMHTAYLYAATGRTSFVLGIYQTVAGVLAGVASAVHINLPAYAYCTGLVLVAVYIYLVIALHRTLKTTRRPIVDAHSLLPQKNAPSVTIAIPARNETIELQECIRSLLASTYQKIEILVLDDCSQEKTSDIIKSFAHQGVRFIQGDEPGDAWLAKNAAYEKLLNEATGDYIVYCGVDVRVGPDTVRALLDAVYSLKVSMLSVMPSLGQSISRPSVLQYARYMWELVVPRKLSKRPPVLSTLWISEVSKLKKEGGFLSVKRMIVPEAHLARTFGKQNSYSFIISDPELDVTSTKNQREQYKTSVRVRYPQLHKRPESVLLVSIASMSVFVLPYALLVYAFNERVLLLQCIAATTVLLQLILLWKFVYRIADKRSMLVALLCAYCAPLADIVMAHYSMFAYEFGSVSWKDRNVCLPIMHVTPSLPRLPDEPR
jgi:glycosyltransferase involved in cell wall biosynthesis